MVAVTLVPLIGPPDGVRSLITRLIPAPEGRGMRRPVQKRDPPFTVSSISCVCAVAADVCQKLIAVGNRVTPVPAQIRTFYFAAGIHEVLVLSYVNPGAVFKASLVVFKTKYHLLFFTLACTSLKGIATSFSPIARNPPTPMIKAVTLPSLSIRTSSMSPILLSDGS